MQIARWFWKPRTSIHLTSCPTQRRGLICGAARTTTPATYKINLLAHLQLSPINCIICRRIIQNKLKKPELPERSCRQFSFSTLLLLSWLVSPMWSWGWRLLIKALLLLTGATYSCFALTVLPVNNTMRDEKHCVKSTLGFSWIFNEVFPWLPQKRRPL